MLNITIRGHDLSQVQTIEDLAEKTKEQGIHTLQLALGLSFPEMSSGANEINSGMGNYVKRVLEKQEVSVGIFKLLYQYDSSRFNDTRRVADKVRAVSSLCFFLWCVDGCFGNGMCLAGNSIYGRKFHR